MKHKLPELLVARDLAPDVDKARRMIGAGEVYVDGQLADKAGAAYLASCDIQLKRKRKYVSRGGYKLEAALNSFGVNVNGLVVADIGASTGGFTDCLLHYGAKKVYAIDVAYGELAWRLRQDARVKVIERTNARYLETLPEPVDLLVSDLSFISLKTVYATAVNWFGEGGQVVSLIKPQFEARPEQVGAGGVVRDPMIHAEVLHKVITDFAALNLTLQDLMVSPVIGPAGNIEFLGRWHYHGVLTGDVDEMVARAMEQAAQLKRNSHV